MIALSDDWPDLNRRCRPGKPRMYGRARSRWRMSSRDVSARGCRTARRSWPIDGRTIAGRTKINERDRAAAYQTRGDRRSFGIVLALWSASRGMSGLITALSGGDGVTQFGRALSELNIDIICANSPQAKGRVERAFGTLQDRLVKELRLAGISTIAAANMWLPGFIITQQWPVWPRAGERQGSAPEADAGEVGEGD